MRERILLTIAYKLPDNDYLTKSFKYFNHIKELDEFVTRMFACGIRIQNTSKSYTIVPPKDVQHVEYSFFDADE